RSGYHRPPETVAYLTVPEAVQLASDRFGSRPALVTRDGAQSFRDLAAAVAAAGAALHGMAVGPGDRVLLLSRNSPDAVRAWLGAMHAGAVPAAVDPRLTPAELRALASDLAPAAVLADAEAAETGGRL